MCLNLGKLKIHCLKLRGLTYFSLSEITFTVLKTRSLPFRRVRFAKIILYSYYLNPTYLPVVKMHTSIGSFQCRIRISITCILQLRRLRWQVYLIVRSCVCSLRVATFSVTSLQSPHVRSTHKRSIHTMSIRSYTMSRQECHFML